MNIFPRRVLTVLPLKHSIGDVRILTSFSLRSDDCQKYNSGTLLFQRNPRKFSKFPVGFPQGSSMLDLDLHKRDVCKKNLHQASQKQSSEFLISEPIPDSLSLKFVNACPQELKPYLRLMRMDRPIGTWLVFLPCAWSISMAAPAGHLPDPKMLFLFGIGSFLMRGAGCIINDMWDRDFDVKVARTKSRPIASGEVTRFKALCFLSIPLSMSLSILLTFNWNTILLGVFSMAPCIAYPLAKRFTYWPQAFLGFTFNWGVVMGWSAVCNSLDWVVAPLYLSSIAWTLLYDTVYAYQDINDDLKIGVKSTAIRFGDNTKYWLSGFGICTTGGLLTTGLLCNQPWLYFGGVAAFASHMAHQIWSVDLKSGEDCSKKFRSNRNLGIMLWIIIMASNLLKKEEEKKEPVKDITLEHSSL